VLENVVSDEVAVDSIDWLIEGEKGAAANTLAALAPLREAIVAR
jgi:hypothetical protein